MRLAAFLILAAVGLASPVRADVLKVHGVPLPNGAVMVGDASRWRLQETFDAALKFYRGVYKPEKYPRRLIVNQPALKALHIENPDSAGEWEGFNLYRVKTDTGEETRLYVLERARKKT